MAGVVDMLIPEICLIFAILSHICHEVILECVAFSSAADRDRSLAAIGENVGHSMQSKAKEDSK